MYNLGHAIETVKIRFDLDEISDADLPEVVRAIRTGAACRDYNLLSGFVVTNLATLFETSPTLVNSSCNVWTRGQLRKFLKLEKTPKEEERGSLAAVEEEEEEEKEARKTAGEGRTVVEEMG